MNPAPPVTATIGEEEAMRPTVARGRWDDATGRADPYSCCVPSRLDHLRERTRRFGRRLGRQLEPLGYIPLRLPGVLLVVASVLVMRFARERADYVLYPASLAALGLLGACALFTTLASLALWRSVRKIEASGVPDQLETLQPLTTGFRFRRLVAWPLVETRMRWDRPVGMR